MWRMYEVKNVCDELAWQLNSGRSILKYFQWMNETANHKKPLCQKTYSLCCERTDTILGFNNACFHEVGSLRCKLVLWSVFKAFLSIRLHQTVIYFTFRLKRWLRRWCSGIMQDSHSCDPGSIPGRRKMFYFLNWIFLSVGWEFGHFLMVFWQPHIFYHIKPGHLPKLNMSKKLYFW